MFDELFTDVQYWGVMCCSGGIWPGGDCSCVWLRAPIILSAVLTVRCNLLMSVLVADPNQTLHRSRDLLKICVKMGPVS